RTNAGGVLNTCKSNAEAWSLTGWRSGERVSNTWVTCPVLWDKPWKRGLIPHRTLHRMVGCGKVFFRYGVGPRPISLLVGGWPAKAMTGSRPERATGHTGTETRPRLLREAAVGSIAQWA